MRSQLAASTTLLLAVLASGCSTISSRHDGPIAGLVHIAGPQPFSARVSARDEAADNDGPVREGGYVGITNVYESVRGDFDRGGLIFGQNGDLFLVPNLDSGAGVGLQLGVRRERRAFELTFQYSEHEDTVVGNAGDTRIYTAGLAWKEFYCVEEAMQPYTLLGLSLPFLAVEQGVVSGTQITDSTLDGYSIDVGGGVAFYPNDGWSVFAQGVYHFSRVVHADGILDAGPIAPDIDSDGWSLSVGASYTF